MSQADDHGDGQDTRIQDTIFAGALAQEVPEEKAEEMDDAETVFVAVRAAVIDYTDTDEDGVKRTFFQDIECDCTGEAWISAEKTVSLPV